MRFSNLCLCFVSATVLTAGLLQPSRALVEADRSWQIEQKSGEWLAANMDAKRFEEKCDYAGAVAKITVILEERKQLGLDLLSEQLELADLCEKMKDLGKADDWHKQAIEGREREGGDDDPTTIFPIQSYADFLRRTNKLEESKKQLSKIAYIEKQRTAPPKELVNLGVKTEVPLKERSNQAVSIGDLYLKRDQENRALMAYNKAIIWDPTNSAAYAARGETYMRQEKDASGKRDLDRAISLSSRNARARFHRAMYYERADKYKLAETDFTEALAANPDDTEIRGYRAKMYQNTKRPALAVADYTEVLKIKPQTRWSLVQRGLCYMDLKDYTKAVADFQELLKVTPGNKDYFNLLADAYKGLEGPSSENAKKYRQLAEQAK